MLGEHLTPVPTVFIREASVQRPVMGSVPHSPCPLASFFHASGPLRRDCGEPGEGARAPSQAWFCHPRLGKEGPALSLTNQSTSQSFTGSDGHSPNQSIS